MNPHIWTWIKKKIIYTGYVRYHCSQKAVAMTTPLSGLGVRRVVEQTTLSASNASELFPQISICVNSFLLHYVIRSSKFHNVPGDYTTSHCITRLRQGCRLGASRQDLECRWLPSKRPLWPSVATGQSQRRPCRLQSCDLLKYSTHGCRSPTLLYCVISRKDSLSTFILQSFTFFKYKCDYFFCN